MAVPVRVAHARPKEETPVAAHVAALLRNLDWMLLAAVAALVAYGLWVLDAVTRNDVPGEPNHFVVRQGANVALGAVALAAAAFVNPEIYRRFRRPLYLVLLGLLLVVFVADQIRGTNRWIEIGFFRFQPSEIGKVLIALVVASFLAERARRLDEWRTTLATVGIAAVPTLLVFIEPDFGTALIYGAIVAAAVFVAGTRWVQLAALALAGAPLVDRRLLVAVAVLLAYQTLVAMVFVGATRYRVPWDFLLALAAGATVVTLADEPPPGWLGKPRACAAGAEGATTEWLAFVDADVTLLPSALPTMAAATCSTSTSIVGGLVCESFWERLLLPELGLALVQEGLPPGFASGQCLLVRRDHYEAVGGHGHASVRGSVVDDRDLALALGGHDARLAPRLMQARMYRSLGEIGVGLVKNQAGLHPRPLPHLATLLLPVASRRPWAAMVVSAGGRAVAGQSPLYGLAAPVARLALAGLYLESAWRARTGRGVRWKGREVVPPGPAGSRIERFWPRKVGRFGRLS